MSWALVSTKMAEGGIPCAAAALAITSASTNPWRVAPPVKMMRGATPRSLLSKSSTTIGPVTVACAEGDRVLSRGPSMVFIGL